MKQKPEYICSGFFACLYINCHTKRTVRSPQNHYCHFTHHENSLKINPLLRLAIEKSTSWEAFINTISFLLSIPSNASQKTAITWLYFILLLIMGSQFKWYQKYHMIKNGGYLQPKRNQHTKKEINLKLITSQWVSSSTHKDSFISNEQKLVSKAFISFVI